MSTIAFLGLGAMGRRMARRLVQAGHDVVVWNRSGVPDDMYDLRERMAPTPRAAASSADVVISMVTDDAASTRVWEDRADGALGALRPGVIAIESSTVTPGRVVALAARVGAAGGRFLDAPVVGSLPAAESGTLLYLVGGDEDVLERAAPILSAMGTAIHPLGPTPAGAIVKLLVNVLFGVQVAALAELFALARQSGIDLARATDVMATLPVMSPAAKGGLASMVAGQFAPLFPIRLLAKDLGYALAFGAETGSALPLTLHVCQLFSEAIENGLGDAHLTAVVRLFPRPAVATK